MRLLKHKRNPHNGVLYRLIFDSREWEWIIYAAGEAEPSWVRLCKFNDLDLAELHFRALTCKLEVNAHKTFEMEEMP